MRLKKCTSCKIQLTTRNVKSLGQMEGYLYFNCNGCHSTVMLASKERKAKMAEKHYMNFILNALAGRNPDKYFRQHQEAILKHLRILQRDLPVSSEKIYRGILLEPKKELVLKPLWHITYLSFSSDRNVAKVFADMDHQMAFMVRFQNPNYEGFLIEHTPEPDEILFHHSWAGPLRIEEIFRASGAEPVVAEQKEVMLLNTMRDFKLIPVQRGCSVKRT